MEKKAILIIILFYIIILCFGKSDNINFDFKKNLLGTWNPKIEEHPIAQVYVPNVSAVFYDIEETINTKKIIVDADANSAFEIQSYKEIENNKFLCSVYEDESGSYEVIIQFIDKNKIKITNGNLFFASEIYYKISSLNLSNDNIYIPNVEKLSFRENPTVESKRIRILTPNDKLELLEKGKEETIDGKKGTWLKVKTEKGEVGWCFDAYLKEWTEDVKKN